MAKPTNSKKEISEEVKKISEGILSKAIDVVLVSLYFGFEFSTAGYGRGYKAGEKAANDLSGLNYKSIKNALLKLKNKGLIETVRDNLVLPEITEEGERRIKSIIPYYDIKRVWDKKVYLITYDFPKVDNHKRNIFRDFLKKIGCGMLQESVWLTPYNPNELVKNYIDEHDFYENLIIVSAIGKDGTVGGMELPDLMEKVYNLAGLNERYQEFLNEAGQLKSDRTGLIFSYLSILFDDPQLPFKLLPEDWVGNEAYNMFVKLEKVATRYARA